MEIKTLDQEMVKKFNRLKVEKYECKAAIKAIELDPESEEKDDIELLNQEIASIDNEIRKLFESPIEINSVE